MAYHHVCRPLAHICVLLLLDRTQTEQSKFVKYKLCLTDKVSFSASNILWSSTEIDCSKPYLCSLVASGFSVLHWDSSCFSIRFQFNVFNFILKTVFLLACQLLVSTQSEANESSTSQERWLSKWTSFAQRFWPSDNRRLPEQHHTNWYILLLLCSNTLLWTQFSPFNQTQKNVYAKATFWSGTVFLSLSTM